ncbi:MAG TPA: AAA family ATPase [Thermoanaerobaculia bacterium]|jgi:chloramphenicol 3-O phosphotransferase
MATVVVLNGTSSSGKTSVARAFQEAVGSLFLNFSIDSVLYALPASALERIKRGEGDAGAVRYAELVQGFYACVRELAALGLDLVIDHAVTTRGQAELLLAAVASSHRTLLVGLECPIDVLNTRELERGDRRVGLAAGQCERIHRWLQYDLTIDTSRTAPEEAARRIVTALASSDGDAIRRTRAMLTEHP